MNARPRPPVQISMRTALIAATLLLICTSLWAEPVPRPAPLIADGAWAGALKAHPRVLGPAEHLKALAKADPQGYQRIVGLKDNLMATGIVHAVEGAPAERIAPHLKRAMENVARGATNVHQDTWIWMEQVALCYDLFHDQIPAADRAKMIDWLNANRKSFTDDEGAFHNSTLSKTFCYLRIAYATWGDNPQAKDFRDHAINRLYEGLLLPVIVEFGRGGGYTECGWYTRGSLWHLVQGLELARRFEGYDGFAKAPAFYYSRLALELHQPYPGIGPEYREERFATEGDGSNIYGGHREYPRLTRNLLAQYFRGSELARYTAGRNRRASNPESAMMDFLAQEPPQEKLAMDTAPLAHLASGIGRLYARGDWSDSATWLRFECGDHFTQHQHYEAGNFEIFRYAPLATESGEYSDWKSPHAANWLIRTIAHNCILIHQPDEVFNHNRRPSDGVIANDGGQGNNAIVAGTLEQWKKQQAKMERGDIVAYQNTPEFMYVAGDCTKAYAPSKAAQVVRQLVFLRPHTFVIIDRVTSTKAEYGKTWLLHCTNEPKLGQRTAEIASGQGRLFVQTLLPKETRMEKIEGYTYGGKTYEAAKGALNKAADRWRIEVKPASPRTGDLFVHALSTEKAPAATVTTEGASVRVKGEGWEVMLDGKGTGSVTINGKTTKLAAEVTLGKYE